MTRKRKHDEVDEKKDETDEKKDEEDFIEEDEELVFDEDDEDDEDEYDEDDDFIVDDDEEEDYYEEEDDEEIFLARQEPIVVTRRRPVKNDDEFRVSNVNGTVITFRRQSRNKDDEGPPKKKVDLECKIETLDDLIKLSETITVRPDEEYSVNVDKIKALTGPLKDLKDMVGLSNIKQSIVDHLLFLLSGLGDGHLMHTVLYGPPGSGKTHLGLILSEIYRALGYSNGKFRIVKRSDLVAGYLGQTTLKTQSAINSVLGGVLFIDEAYSLGSPEQRDSFSKEMIDCLNQNLSENKSKFICIIAGYREELEKCFFAANPGLKRRFPFQYTIHKYGPHDLFLIFQTKVTKDGWKLVASDIVLEKAFRLEFKYFVHQGGDIENLVQRCKIAHSKRVFGRHQTEKRVLNTEDFETGLKAFLSHKKHSTRYKRIGSKSDIDSIANNYLQALKKKKII